MRQQASPEFLERFWKAGFPGQIPDRLVIAEELKGNVIDLEGHDLVTVELGHTDTDHTTCLNVPSVGLVIAGDAAYNDVHLYLAESDPQGRREWLAALDTIDFIAAFASSVVESTPMVLPRTSPACASCSRTQVKIR